MQDVKSGAIDCIVVKDLSRFGRNYLETGNYLERIFPFAGVRFIAIADHLDTLEYGMADGYLAPLKNIINEAYSRDISQKASSALAVRQRRGEFIGAWACYGYRKCAWDPHKIEPDEETAPVVADIFQMRLSGMGYGQIARILNSRGIPSPSHYHYLKGDIHCSRYTQVLWQGQMVKKILSSQVYLGHMVQGCRRGHFYKREKQKRLPESEWAIVYHTHKPIIDEETYRTVQEIAAGRGKQP